MNFRKYFDETAVDFFRCFTLVDSKGESLFELKPLAYNVGKGMNKRATKRDPLKDTESPERKARVAQLAAIYAECEPQEISPFDM